VMQVLVGLTHVGVMRSATWLLPNAPLLLDTLVAHQVCSVEALVRSCHAKASHFQFDRKFITLTLQHVSTQLEYPIGLVSKKISSPQVLTPFRFSFSTLSTYCNSTIKIATPRFANFLKLNCLLVERCFKEIH